MWPEPQTSGASTRILQLINCLLSAEFQVVIASAATESTLSADCLSLGVQTHTIKLNDASFDDFIKTVNPELVIFDKYISEEQYGWRVATYCPDAIRVLDTVDLHCLRSARAEKCKVPKRELMLNNPIALREIAAIYRSDLSLFVAEYEIELLINHFKVPSVLLYYHPLTVDTLQSPSEKSFAHRKDFIAIGSFLHPPNWDAVLTLKNKLWPSIRQHLPKATLNIFGSYPPPKAIALTNPKERFIVKGFVENDFDAMQQSRVHLAPLRFGAGIKSKCVLAFRAGTPTITTSIGAEGLMPSDHWAGRICENDKTFIEAAIHFYQNESAFIEARNQSKLIINHFYFKRWNASLIDTLKSIKKELKPHRARNFTGQMLLHHQHLSTRYMAKWIEAKNQTCTNTSTYCDG